MPGLMGRFSTVVKSKISKQVDRAENPSETLDYAYERQVENLQNVKKAIADIATAKKRLALQQQQLGEQGAKLDAQARVRSTQRPRSAGLAVRAASATAPPASAGKSSRALRKPRSLPTTPARLTTQGHSSRPLATARPPLPVVPLTPDHWLCTFVISA